MFARSDLRSRPLRMTAPLAPWALCAILSCLLPIAPAQATLATKLVNSLLDHPVYMDTTPGNAILAVLEQPGRIRTINANGTLNQAPLLDLTAVIKYVGGDEERGLLGIAFPPDHSTTALFYVYYVSNAGGPGDPGILTVAEYMVNPGGFTADPNSARILLQIPKPVTGVPEEYHNGGTIAFGPIDGLLYLGVGDGQGFNGYDPNNCAQTDASIMGKLVRFDPAAIPPGGITIPGGACPQPIDPLITVVGKGLRNPYRFSFDRMTGDLYIGDVGQDLVEEVDVVPAASVAPGLNFGWRVMEGDQCLTPDPPPSPPCFDASLTAPAYSYLHFSGGVCEGTVIGGVVYRGAIPALQGKYLFADYCHGQIFSADFDGTSSLQNVTDITSQLLPDIGTIDNPTGFGVDGAGEVYIVDSPALGGFGDLFKILSLEPEPVIPADMSVLSASGLLPSFTAYPGAQSLFQFEFSTDPVGFTNSILNNKKAKFGTSVFLKKKTWKKVQALGAGGVPVYWRVLGKATKKSPATVASTTSHAFTVGP